MLLSRSLRVGTCFLGVTLSCFLRVPSFVGGFWGVGHTEFVGPRLPWQLKFFAPKDVEQQSLLENEGVSGFQIGHLV